MRSTARANWRADESGSANPHKVALCKITLRMIGLGLKSRLSERRPRRYEDRLLLTSPGTRCPCGNAVVHLVSYLYCVAARTRSFIVSLRCAGAHCRTGAPKAH